MTSRYEGKKSQEMAPLLQEHSASPEAQVGKKYFCCLIFCSGKWITKLLEYLCLNQETYLFDTCVIHKTFPSQASCQEYLPDSIGVVEVKAGESTEEEMGTVLT